MYSFFIVDAGSSHLGFQATDYWSSSELEFQLQEVFLMTYSTANSKILTFEINWDDPIIQTQPTQLGCFSAIVGIYLHLFFTSVTAGFGKLFKQIPPDSKNIILSVFFLRFIPVWVVGKICRHWWRWWGDVLHNIHNAIVFSVSC